MPTTPKNNYTKPELREQLKQTIIDGDKGGRPGQWSARKAQLLTHEYEAAGGGYKTTKRTGAQKHLEAWTEEKWQTASGQPAADGEKMHRYLPKKAWSKLSPAEKKSTDARKVRASKTGQQFVPNTPAAKRARQTSVKKSDSATRIGNASTPTAKSPRKPAAVTPKIKRDPRAAAKTKSRHKTRPVDSPAKSASKITSTGHSKS